MSYGLKEDVQRTLAVGTNQRPTQKIWVPIDTLTCEEMKRDCIIEPEEEWLQLLSPLG